MTSPTVFRASAVFTAAFLLALELCVPSLLPVHAAELPVLRVAHGAFNEKIGALWIGVEQGFFRKNGIDVEVVDIRNGPLTIQALASGEVQVAYTVPSSVLSAAAGGIDVAFFAGLINRPDGDLIVTPEIRTAQDLKHKRLGIQSVGGGVWSMTLLALEYFGLEPNRDDVSLVVIGDQSVLARAFMASRIDGAYLSYGYRHVLRDTKHRLLLDLGKTSIPYQGLALATQRVYLRQHPRIIDGFLRGVAESIVFIQNPSNKAAVLKSLGNNLRFKRTQQAESAYDALQWLYSLDMEPNKPGIQNVSRLLAVHNPRMTKLTAERVIDSGPMQRLRESVVYRRLAQAN
jgi:ABC-type nitrate/sulfonate/bicarbonate transport system substrate-binding protein